MKQQVAIQNKQNIIFSCRFFNEKINDVEIFRITFKKIDYIVKNKSKVFILQNHIFRNFRQR